MDYVWIVQGGWSYKPETSQFGVYKTLEGAKKGANERWGTHRPPLEWEELNEAVWVGYGTNDYQFDLSLHKVEE